MHYMTCIQALMNGFVLHRMQHWLRITCLAVLANGLKLPQIPAELSCLNALELRLTPLCLPFMKMVALPSGKWRCIHEPTVNVPSKLDSVCVQYCLGCPHGVSSFHSNWSADSVSHKDLTMSGLEPFLCSGDGQCYNTKGSFTCQCNNNFIGDGFNCTEMGMCATIIMPIWGQTARNNYGMT